MEILSSAHFYFQIQYHQDDHDEMVNSDEKNEELETFPPSDNDTLFNQKKKQKQNLKRIILSMIAFSVVSLSN